MDIKWKEAPNTLSSGANLIQDSLENMPRLSIGKALLILLSCDERDFNLALSKQHEYSGTIKMTWISDSATRQIQTTAKIVTT